MKRILLLIGAALCVAGCGNGVYVNATYSQLLDQSAAQAASDAQKAQAGQLTQAQETEALVGDSTAWQMFRDARDGKASAIPAVPVTTAPATQGGN